MTDDENARASARAIAQKTRLSHALRENLKRRKSQSRGRAEQSADDPAGDTSLAPHLRTTAGDPDPE